MVYGRKLCRENDNAVLNVAGVIVRTIHEYILVLTQGYKQTDMIQQRPRGMPDQS